MSSYTVADDDKVSLRGNIIDDGWMEGHLEHTGQHGMLLSNYVERV